MDTTSSIRGPRGRLVTTARLALSPYGFSHACARYYGDLFTLPLLAGDLTLIGHPDGVRALFSAPSECFDIFGREALTPAFGRRSLFTASPQERRPLRRALSPPVQRLPSGAARAILAHAEALRPGRPLDLQRFALDASLDVVLLSLFGEVDPEDHRATSRYLSALSNPLFSLPLLYPKLRVRFGPWGRFTRARDALQSRVLRRVKEGRLAPEFDPLRQALDEETLCDNLITMILAGHETTAEATAWAFDLLLQTPDALARLQEELASLPKDAPAFEVSALPFLDATCREALRLRPVVAQVTRLLRAPLSVMGRDFSAGAALASSVLLVHTRPELYPEPDAFRPERFLARAYGPFEWLPFGGGFGRCLGASFAIEEMKLLLFYVLRRWRVAPVRRSGARPALRGLVVCPAQGAPAVLSPWPL